MSETYKAIAEICEVDGIALDDVDVALAALNRLKQLTAQGARQKELIEAGRRLYLQLHNAKTILPKWADENVCMAMRDFGNLLDPASGSLVPLHDSQDSYYPCKRMMLQQQPYADCFPAENCDGCDCWRQPSEEIIRKQRDAWDDSRQRSLTESERAVTTTRHARDCEYVTSDGPAPCTCASAEKGQ